MVKFDLKASQVDELHREISSHFLSFQTKNNLACPSSCGKCCTYPDIQCSVLEAIPLAIYLNKNEQLQEMKEKIQNRPTDSLCHLFQPIGSDGTKGFCSLYQYRPIICRIFGAYAHKNKSGRYQLALCSVLKQEKRNLDSIEGLDFQSSFSYWTKLLDDIDPYLAKDVNPINISLSKAIELVEQYNYLASSENDGSVQVS